MPWNSARSVREMLTRILGHLCAELAQSLFQRASVPMSTKPCAGRLTEANFGADEVCCGVMPVLKTLCHLIEASGKANNRNLQRAVDGFYLDAAYRTVF